MRPARRRESLAERRQRRAAVDDPQVVLEAAARFLEARQRSVTEVRRRLRGAGYRPELVDGAIERLLELGILDDEAFARAVGGVARPGTAARGAGDPRGAALKGIDRATIDAVLEERREGDEGEPDRDAAERLIERNARSLARVADPRQRRARAYALLARNGFDPDVCREVAATGLATDSRTPLMLGTARDHRADRPPLHPIASSLSPQPSGDRDQGHAGAFAHVAPDTRSGTHPARAHARTSSELRGRGVADRW